jgi:sterol O-acyltransferase
MNEHSKSPKIQPINHLPYLNEENGSTIKKLKSILKEYEKDEDNFKTSLNKQENVSDILKTSLNLVCEDPQKNLEKINEDLNNWIECSKIEMEIIQNSIDEYNISTNTDKIKKKRFQEKNHVYRESFLSVLFYNDKNLKSLYYLILNLFTWLLLWVMMNDYKNTQQIIDTNFWKENFAKFDLLLIYWTAIFLYSYLIVIFIQSINYFAKKNKYIPYYPIFVIYFTYQAFLYFSTFIVVSQSEFCLPNKLILATECTRFSLKIHGYFREKMLYGLGEFHLNYVNYFPDCQVENIVISDLFTEVKKFLYYIFCPSLIYRDQYPRITKTRWYLIFAHLINFIFCCLFYYILMRYICEPYFNYSKIKDYYSLPHFIFDSLRFGIPGVSFLLVGFFLLLHSWLNLWSEILRHGDRRFYEDWWNCTNFEEYYRKWNMVVHEWLYYYVYNDVLRLSLGKLNRFHAKLIVFALSVILHEGIIWIALGFFFPILSFFFGGPGIIFTYIKPKSKNFNIVFWCKLFLGQGLLLVFYLREFNMRSILNELGLVKNWHEWFPRTILMFFESYQFKIKNSRFY